VQESSGTSGEGVVPTYDAPGSNPPLEAPQIVVTDCSQPADREEARWRESFLQNALNAGIPEKSTSQESEGIIRMLKQAIVYAMEENGLVPQYHIDHIYRQVYLHIKGEVEDEKGSRNDRKMRKAGTRRRGRKRYRYARTQDLFKRNPGQLARHIRNGTEWLDPPETRPTTEDVSSLFQSLRGDAQEIKQPFEVDQEERGCDLMELIPDISTVEIAMRVARIKRDSALGQMVS
jgi:hypothetical protein